MSINKELNEKDLENVYGGPIKSENLPPKFKNAGFNEYGEIVRDGSAPAISQDDDIPTFKPPGEMSEKDLEAVFGGPIKREDLPDGFLK